MTRKNTLRAFDCPQELWDAFDELAQANGITRAEQLRLAMEQQLRTSGRAVPARTRARARSRDETA